MTQEQEQDQVQEINLMLQSFEESDSISWNETLFAPIECQESFNCGNYDLYEGCEKQYRDECQQEQEQEQTKSMTGELIQIKEVLPQTEGNSHSTLEKPKTKRGRRKIQSEDYCNIEKNDQHKQPYHSKQHLDNIRRKIKVHFFNFIIKFLNSLIKTEWKGQQHRKFRTVNHNCTKQITIEPNVELFSGTIRDLMSKDVSPKYGRKADVNKTTCAYLSEQKPEIFNKMFNITLREFYHNFFLKNLDFIKKEYNIELLKDKNQSKLPLCFQDRCVMKEKECMSNYRELIKENEEYLIMYRKEGLKFMDFFSTKKKKVKKEIFTVIENYTQTDDLV